MNYLSYYNNKHCKYGDKRRTLIKWRRRLHGVSVPYPGKAATSAAPSTRADSFEYATPHRTHRADAHNGNRLGANRLTNRLPCALTPAVARGRPDETTYPSHDKKPHTLSAQGTPPPPPPPPRPPEKKRGGRTQRAAAGERVETLRSVVCVAA